MRNIVLNSEGLVTLRGQDIPDVVDDGFFDCANNHLSSLKFGPKEVKDNFWCNNNRLTSLEFCATKIDNSLFCASNSFLNLKDIHKQFKDGYIGNKLAIEENLLESHLLGIILIPKLQRVFMDNRTARDIINKHLKSGRDVLECQEELIQNGFKEFARL